MEAQAAAEREMIEAEAKDEAARIEACSGEKEAEEKLELTKELVDCCIARHGTANSPPS